MIKHFCKQGVLSFLPLFFVVYFFVLYVYHLNVWETHERPYCFSVIFIGDLWTPVKWSHMSLGHTSQLGGALVP